MIILKIKETRPYYSGLNHSFLVLLNHLFSLYSLFPVAKITEKPAYSVFTGPDNNNTLK